MIEEISGKKSKRIMRDALTTIVPAVIFALFVLMLIRPVIVSGDSMYPTLEDRDYLIISKAAYFGSSSPERGDIVIFDSGDAEDRLYCKRIIGIPGDTVEIKSGKVYLNGSPLSEPYLPEGTYTEEDDTNGPVIVQEDEYFCLGDNREVSLDSRSIGCIEEDAIIGKAVLRLLPVNEIGSLKGK